MSLIAFSQKGTVNIINKDNINLPKPVAVEVVKDLMRGDSAVDELKLVYNTVDYLNGKIVILSNKIEFKDQEIQIWKQKDQDNKNIINFKDEQLFIVNSSVKNINKELKQTKRKLLGTKVVGIIVVGTLTYLLVTK